MNYTPFCAGCWRDFRDKEVTYPSKNKLGFHVCRECSVKEDMLQWIQWSTKPCYLRKENMPNIKITTEVDGKIVPLNTISTESFEAIKALEKPKEIPIPVARVGNWRGDLKQRRLFLKLNHSIRSYIDRDATATLIIDLNDGMAIGRLEGLIKIDSYENVKPL